MITIRPAAARGITALDWLDSRHSFSFGDYYDPTHMGFGPLRVINEDRVKPGKGFGAHGHRDMEIVSYVLSGTLEHRDSTGRDAVIRPGEVQRMSAGKGVMHSEFNPSDSDPVHFLQIWILPERTGLQPSYAQEVFSEGERRNRLRLIATRGGRYGALAIHQDVDLYAALLAPDDRVFHSLADGRNAWLQIARGSVTLNGVALSEGDGAAIHDEATLDITGVKDAEVLLFDMV